MITLQEKIEQAQTLIQRVLSVYKRPVIMSSFGKDSMCLLDLFKQLSIKLPILFHREPYFPSKYTFANSIIAADEYSVYDYVPSEFTVITKGDVTEIAKWYRVGENFLYLPIGIAPLNESKPFVCGYWDMYNRPTGNFKFPWDIAFHGHKASDADPLLGALPLTVDVKVNEGSVDYAYPLRHFTDEDIYEYTRKFQVPWNYARYGSLDAPSDDISNDANSDYHNACVRCLDPNEPSTVFCPVLKSEISNISSQLRRTSPDLPIYVGGKK